MKQALQSLDIEQYIGEITLSDGSKLNIPKLSMFKIIRIVKFIGVDGSKIWDQARSSLLDESMTDMEKVAVIIEGLKEEQLIRILSILLDVEDRVALQFDLNEVLDVFLVYAEKTNLSKTFTQVQKLAKKMFNKDIPNFKTLLDNLFPENDSSGVKLSKSS